MKLGAMLSPSKLNGEQENDYNKITSTQKYTY